jgi:hypothetical protein
LQKKAVGLVAVLVVTTKRGTGRMVRVNEGGVEGCVVCAKQVFLFCLAARNRGSMRDAPRVGPNSVKEEGVSKRVSFARTQACACVRGVFLEIALGCAKRLRALFVETKSLALAEGLSQTRGRGREKRNAGII